MAYTAIRLRRDGGNGTGYTGEVTDEADYVDVPNDSYFKHRDKYPETDVVLFKNSDGDIIDPAHPDFFADMWAANTLMNC